MNQFKPFIKVNLVLISGLVGLFGGSLSSSAYYQIQRKQEIRAFLECQAAWVKYYSLTNPTNQTNQTTQPITTNQSFWQLILQSSLRIAQTKVQEFNQPFNLEQQKYLVYQYEVLPKCNKLKAWEKEVDKHFTNKGLRT